MAPSETPAEAVPLPRRANILGLRISVTDYNEATRCIIDRARRRQRMLVAALDVHTVIQAQHDPAFAAALNTFDLLAPDGQPVRWGLQLTRQAQLDERVYGPTLMLRVCERAAHEGLPVFLYGSREGTLHALQAKLQQRLPALRIAGLRAGRFRALTAQEQAADAAEINGSGAALVLVGMGSPAQQWWSFHMRSRVSAPIMAVGAAFDFHAGLVPQAPPWMQDRGFEWLFRLAHEPHRLWRRYLLITPQYVPLIAAQALGLREFPEAAHPDPGANRECPG
ncbi:MAG TPA: WecB/TagA/CpsF family glycosyltransferase [Polyangiales bacterium]|jgi:exopolysaccharide biosynthesis WecB/TagA/CpsF family protein|nr:WecB/TagA/CpsF family glycosyltransferase [Polyangiales bacterium]